MLGTTIEAISAMLRADPTLTPPERARVLELIKTPTQSDPGPATDRILSRAETARRLNRTTRTVDGLAAAGTLKRVKLPGRTRGAGFRESDVLAIVNG